MIYLLKDGKCICVFILYMYLIIFLVSLIFVCVQDDYLLRDGKCVCVFYSLHVSHYCFCISCLLLLQVDVFVLFFVSVVGVF